MAFIKSTCVLAALLLAVCSGHLFPRHRPDGRRNPFTRSDPCAEKGTLEERLNLVKQNNDANGDGTVAGQEIVNDLTNNYDSNSDGCVTREEWNTQWLNNYQLSPEYANARFTDLVGDAANSACPVNASNFLMVSMPLDAFFNSNIETLIGVCDANPFLYMTNCDCRDLAGFCSSADFYKDLQACVDYTAAGQSQQTFDFGTMSQDPLSFMKFFFRRMFNRQ